MQRIGVFVCWCGSNIAGTVDVQAASDALKKRTRCRRFHQLSIYVFTSGSGYNQTSYCRT